MHTWTSLPQGRASKEPYPLRVLLLPFKYLNNTSDLHNNPIKYSTDASLLTPKSLKRSIMSPAFKGIRRAMTMFNTIYRWILTCTHQPSPLFHTAQGSILTQPFNAKVVTICTDRFNGNKQSTFCPHCVFMCFVRISEKKIHHLPCILISFYTSDGNYVYCAVRTEYLNIIHVQFCLRLNLLLNNDS